MYGRCSRLHRNIVRPQRNLHLARVEFTPMGGTLCGASHTHLPKILVFFPFRSRLIPKEERTTSSVDCNDRVDCTADSCNEDTDSCDHTADDGSCDDGQFCNGSETYDAINGCQPGTDPCDGDDCDEDTDSCVSATCPGWQCDGDANGDGFVDPLDDGLIQARFGEDPCVVACGADMYCDGFIDPLDDGYAKARFGSCNPPPPCMSNCN